MAAFLKILQSLTQLDLVYILLPGGREPGCGLSSQSPGFLFPFPRLGCLRQGLTGSAFQSEERDQLVIHNLPVMSLAPNEFSPSGPERSSPPESVTLRPLAGVPPLKPEIALELCLLSSDAQQRL